MGWESPALDLDLVEPEPAEAKRLERRLLGREAGSEVRCGTSARVRGLELPLGEDPLCQRRSPFERPLDPLDLDQIDAGAAGHSASFSTYRWMAVSSS